MSEEAKLELDYSSMAGEIVNDSKKLITFDLETLPGVNEKP